MARSCSQGDLAEHGEERAHLAPLDRVAIEYRSHGIDHDEARPPEFDPGLDQGQ